VQRHPAYTRDRIAALVARLHARVHHERRPVDELSLAGPCGRISPAEAARLDYRPARLGEELGPLWATYWLRCSATVPPAWRGDRVDLLFCSFSEATLWLGERPLQGLNQTIRLAAALPDVLEHEDFPDRDEALLLERARGGERSAVTAA
jgi:alpha-mannosidase